MDPMRLGSGGQVALKLRSIFAALLLMQVCAIARASEPSVDVCAATPMPKLHEALTQLSANNVVRATAGSEYVPAGLLARFNLWAPFDKDAAYRVYIHRERPGDTPDSPLTGGSVVAIQLPADDPLVTQKKVSAESVTVVTADIPAHWARQWDPATAYIYSCKNGAVQFVSAVPITLSPRYLSRWIAIGFVLIAYVLVAIAVGIVDRRQKGSSLSLLGWVRYLDPVVLTAGSNGKGDAAKLQIYFFSFVVAGLLAYIIMRLGVLSDVSRTILLLLGISAVGAAASKASDVSKNRLDFENWAWLINKGWLPPNGLAATNQARWRDIVTINGEFDVYRFQMVIFSAVVGGALLACPWGDLATFSIPENLLGILGLSQVVYLGGKLTAPPTFSELDKAVTELRELEKNFLHAALTKPDPSAPAPPAGTPPSPLNLAEAQRRAGMDVYRAYFAKADVLQQMFTSATGLPVARQKLEPAFQ